MDEPLFTPWPKLLHEAGVKLKVITPAHETTKEMLDYNRELGFLVKTISPEIYSSKVSLEAGEDFVRIVLFKPMQALIIKSPELAQSVRQIFDMVYSAQK